jgi:hypothetical protein
MRVDALRSLAYPDGFVPDFSGGPIREYTGRHTLLGETTYREYEGTLNGEAVVWTFAEAAGDRVWIQGIRYRDVLITDFGTYDRVIDSGILTSKPLEYTEQLGNLPVEYRRPVERTDGGPSHYEDITPLLAELEPIRRYREAREPTVVEPVAARRVIRIEDAPEAPTGSPEVPARSRSTHRPLRRGGARGETPTERAPELLRYADLDPGLRTVIDAFQRQSAAEYRTLRRGLGDPVSEHDFIVTRHMDPHGTLVLRVADSLAREVFSDRLLRREGVDEISDGRFRLTTEEGPSIEIVIEVAEP